MLYATCYALHQKQRDAFEVMRKRTKFTHKTYRVKEKSNGKYNLAQHKHKHTPIHTSKDMTAFKMPQIKMNRLKFMRTIWPIDETSSSSSDSFNGFRTKKKRRLVLCLMRSRPFSRRHRTDYFDVFILIRHMGKLGGGEGLQFTPFFKTYGYELNIMI